MDESTIEGVRSYAREIFGKEETRIQRTMWPNLNGELALRMIEHWGQVAAIPDGEDSSGKQKLRLATPQELVDRATETAEIAIRKLDEKRWILHIEPQDA